MKFPHPIRRFLDTMQKEKTHLLQELVRVQGLLPLLMKPRNSQRWTTEEKDELREHFRRVSRISPYIAVVVLPGGLALLPLLAWWLDQRRARRRRQPADPGTQPQPRSSRES